MAGAAKAFLVSLLLFFCLAPPPRNRCICGSRFRLLLSPRPEPGAVLSGAIFALGGAARTPGGCAAQSTGVGTAKAAQKISSTEGGLNASGVALDDDDYFGNSVASLGDFDGDSVTDICVGAYRDDDGEADCGAVYVLFLNGNGTVKASQKISSTQGGLTASGVSLDNRDWFGRSVASVGDFDGDSVSDICVGAALDDDGGIRRGAVYLLFLNNNGTVKASQKISSTQGGLNASGVSLDLDDWFGTSVASVGDVDGDSVTDICVGAVYDDDGGTNRGAVYILSLNYNGTVKAVQKISSTQGGLNASGVSLDDFDLFGISVASVGDLDSDTVTDICVGAEGDDDGGNYFGAVYMLFLNSNGTVKAAQKISMTQGGLSASGVSLDARDYFGESTSAVGDIDGDSVNDICVGAWGDDEGGSSRGAAYLLFLNTNGTVKASQKISSTQGGLNASGVSLDNSDWFGFSVASVGDVDGDSVPDICVGAYGDNDGGSYRGALYLLFLSNGTLPDGTTNAGGPGVTTASSAGNLTSNVSTTTLSSSVAATTAISTGIFTANASSSSMSTGAAATATSGISTAAPGEDSSGSSEPSNNTVLIIVLVAAVCALLVCAVVVAIIRVRHSDAGATRSGLEEVELAQAADYEDLDNSSEGNAGSHQNVADKLDVEIVREVGKGAFGSVFLGNWSGQDVAVKCVTSGNAGELFAELKILEMLKHPRIVRVFGVAEVRSNPAIVMEWCAHGSLDELLKARQDFGPSHFLRFCQQISQGLAFLASKGILHRDLACRNVLADEFGKVKITDFGLSRHSVAGQYLVTSAVPIRWTAVEVLHEKAASTKSDVYSLGIVFVEVYSRAERPYVDLVSNAAVIAAVLAGRRPSQPSIMPSEVYGLAAECWVASPDERPDAATVAERLEDMSLLQEGDSSAHNVTKHMGRTAASDYGVQCALPSSFTTSTEEPAGEGYHGNSSGMTAKNVTSADAEHADYSQMPSPDAEPTDYSQMPCPDADETDCQQMPSHSALATRENSEGGSGQQRSGPLTGSAANEEMDAATHSSTASF